MFSTIAYASEAAATASRPSAIMQMIPFFAIILVFYLLIIRPQQKKQKKLQETVSALKSGDKVITTSGILGTIDSVGDNNTYYVTIASGVKVQIVKSGISGKIESDLPKVVSK